MTAEHGWRVHIAPDWPMLGHRVVIYRPLGDETEVIIGFTEDGTPIAQRQPPGVVSTWQGFALPNAVLDAIAEAIKPGPSQGETRRLEEALNVERKRVDDVLAAATGGLGQ